MKTTIKWIALLALVATHSTQLSATPLGTAFTYQGKLTDGDAPAQGIYDLRLALYDAATNGNQAGTTLTNAAVTVSNGLFTTVLDFGADVFTGDARWLEIGVRTNGGNTFSMLTPRQPVTPMPYALYSPSAGGMAASNLIGTIPDAQLSPNVALLSGSPSFNGTVTAGASPSGAGLVVTGNIFATNNLGVVLDAQNRPLITRGWDPFTSGNYSGIGRWGLFMEPSALTLGIPPSGITAKFQVVSYNANSTINSRKLVVGNGGNVVIDPDQANNGSLVSALTFGESSGEGIASKRTAGGNRYGLDFYTWSSNRMTILLNGDVGIGTTNPGAKLEVNGPVRAAAFQGDGSGLTNLNAGSLAIGVLLSAQFAGTYSSALTFNNRSNSFTGNGSGLTNLNASALTSGFIPNGRLTGIYSAPLMFTSPSNRFWGKFIGDGSMLTNFSYTFTGSNFAGNGYFLTSLNADNIGYGTIADEHLSANIVRQGGDPNFHDVNAGGNVQANGNVVAAADLVGTRLNVGGGHTLQGILSSIAGGTNNAVTLYADYSFVGGGENNAILDSIDSVIAGGFQNTVQDFYSTIGGGNSNTNAGGAAVIGGGEGNAIGYWGWHSTIGGGFNNTMLSDINNSVQNSTIGGGSGNTIQGLNGHATIGGGGDNLIQSSTQGHGTIGGGGDNTIRPDADYATIPGGWNNEAGGLASFAAGNFAHALHDGTFVWADWSGYGQDFASTGPNQFLIRASGGVGINLNNPQATLHVNGTVRATTYYGDGSQLTGILTGGTVSNALYLGGIPASAYATNGHTHSAAAITSGTLADARLSANVALLNSSSLNFSGTVSAGAFAGPGSGLTGLNADNLASGTVPDARLNPSPTFGGTVTAGRLKVGTAHTLLGTRATIAGGTANSNAGTDSTIGGGTANTIMEGYYCAIGGGSYNLISNNIANATIPGGAGNIVSADCGFAAGTHAKAAHLGTFVWGDYHLTDFSSTAQNQFLIRAAGGVGINTNNPQTALHVNGTTRTCVLEITGGCDLAEPFPFSTGQIPKGAVVVIDEANPGRLKLSDLAYDTRVAGIVSGANGIRPGISLNQDDLATGGQNVALSGRVYALADASNGPIQPGDLLTTSATPGHAMKVTNHARAQGAILGKAMTSLKEGRGMVLVLVTLQ